VFGVNTHHPINYTSDKTSKASSSGFQVLYIEIRFIDTVTEFNRLNCLT